MTSSGNDFSEVFRSYIKQNQGARWQLRATSNSEFVLLNNGVSEDSTRFRLATDLDLWYYLVSIHAEKDPHIYTPRLTAKECIDDAVEYMDTFY